MQSLIPTLNKTLYNPFKLWCNYFVGLLLSLFSYFSRNRYNKYCSVRDKVKGNLKINKPLPIDADILCDSPVK